MRGKQSRAHAKITDSVSASIQHTVERWFHERDRELKGIAWDLSKHLEGIEELTRTVASLVNRVGLLEERETALERQSQDVLEAVTNPKPPEPTADPLQRLMDGLAERLQPLVHEGRPSNQVGRVTIQRAADSYDPDNPTPDPSLDAPAAAPELAKPFEPPPGQLNPEDVLDSRQAAAFLGLTRRTLLNMRSRTNGASPPRLSRELYYKPALLAWVEHANPWTRAKFARAEQARGVASLPRALPEQFPAPPDPANGRSPNSNFSKRKAVPTFRQFVEDWIEENVDEWTVQVVRVNCSYLEKHAGPVFGDVPLDQITTESLARFVERLRQKPSNGPNGRPGQKLSERTVELVAGWVIAQLDRAHVQGIIERKAPRIRELVSAG